MGWHGMPEFTVRVRGFTSDTLKLGSVKLGVLRLVEERSWRDSGDPLEALAAVADAYRGRHSYVEIEVSGLEEEPRVVVLGVSPSYEGRKPLFPRPARLLRVGILRESTVRTRGFDERGYAELKVEEDIQWFKVRGKVYVFEGLVEAEPDVVYIVVDTEYGRRWVRVYHRLTLRPASQRAETQAPQDTGGGSGQGEDSSRGE